MTHYCHLSKVETLNRSVKLFFTTYEFIRHINFLFIEKSKFAVLFGVISTHTGGLHISYINE